MKNTQEIFIRDPYIVTNRDKGLYYMFGSTDPNVWQGRCEGFDYYTSRNLREWDGPFPAFKPEEFFLVAREFLGAGSAFLSGTLAYVRQLQGAGGGQRDTNSGFRCAGQTLHSLERWAGDSVQG
ncbi:hypothetical protein QPK87_35385 [Kamptonema cortianum]|nr:hypothetical protein [Kamptonema cortianum]